MRKIVHPQELEVFYILPALRRDLAVSLIQKGMEQKSVAKLLGVSEPSISHYINSKRAFDVKFEDRFKSIIDSAAEELVCKKNLLEATQKLLKITRDDKILCNVCHKINSEHKIPNACKVCF